MSWFGRLFGRKAVVAELRRGRGWTTEVVGESRYQEALRRSYIKHGGVGHDLKVVAVLVPENGNPHDENAVRVEIDGRPVGYLRRSLAAAFRKDLSGASGSCSAKITGGFEIDDGAVAHYGVRLNLAWPARFQ